MGTTKSGMFGGVIMLDFDIEIQNITKKRYVRVCMQRDEEENEETRRRWPDGQGRAREVKINKETQAIRRWGRFSVVGDIQDVAKLCELQRSLESMKVCNVDLRYIGGLKIRITFNSTLEAEHFVLRKAELKEYGMTMTGRRLTYEIMAWIKIAGVSFQLWDKVVFNRIGEQFGGVVHRS
ncbi:hypothetical protein R6Q57_002151 [Mikania cordata]